MGTKVQYKGYLPGYFRTRDLNEDAAHSWPLYYEDAVSSGQLYGAFPPKLMNGYSEYDKEALKQTMLNQDAMFRKQVHELHRVYQKQRELMEELKQKELYHYALQSQSSLPSASSQNKLTYDAEHVQSAPRLWDMNCNHSSHSVSGMETSEPAKVLNNGSRQASVVLTESGDSLKKTELDSKMSKRPRVVIDLQLPANVCVDDETENANEGQGLYSFSDMAKHASSDCDIKPGKHLNLAIGCSGSLGKRESWHKKFRLQDDESSKTFCDLNDPISINGINKDASFISNFFPLKTPQEEAQGHTTFSLAHPSLLNTKNYHYRQKSTGSQLLDQHPFPNNSDRSSHFHMDFSLPELNTFGKSNAEKICNPLYATPRSVKMESDHRDKPTGNNDLFGTCIGSFSNPAPSSSLSTGPSALIPSCSHLGIPSHLGYSQKSSMHGTSSAPIDVDSPLSFNEPIYSNQANHSSKSVFSSAYMNNKLVDRGLTSNQSLGSEVSSHPRGFLHDLNHWSIWSMPSNNMSNAACSSSTQPTYRVDGTNERLIRLESKETKSPKNLDLNLDLSSDCGNDFTFKQEMSPMKTEGKNLKSLEKLPWLRSSPSIKEPQSNLKNMIRSADLSDQFYDRKNPQDLSDQFYDRKNPQRISLFDYTQHFTKPVGYYSSGQAVVRQDELRTPDSSCRNIVIDLEKPASVDMEQPTVHVAQNDASIKRVPINLNSMPVSAQYSHFDINLEMPAIPEMEDEALCCRETLEVDQFIEPVQLAKHEFESNEKVERLQDESTEAAEIIVLMSNHCKNLDPVEIESSAITFTESLMWFADIVCSNIDDPRNMHVISNGGDDNGNFDSDNADFFESMTLRLAETKPEELWTKPLERKEENNHQAGFASLLIGKPKRGLARKRRQKRDFQKDILPGLASLSRHEATEDLHTIGGLMRALGQSWEIGITRRNSGRSGTRGGRRNRGASAATKTRPSLTTAIRTYDTNFVINRTNMLGWGTTRRCRRARCPSGNLMPLLPKE